MLLFIAGFLRGGWSSGFIRRLVGLVFLVVSFVAGAYLRAPAGALVNAFLPKIPAQYADMVGYTVAFSALLLVFNLFSGLILSRIAKTGHGPPDGPAPRARARWHRGGPDHLGRPS